MSIKAIFYYVYQVMKNSEMIEKFYELIFKTMINLDRISI